MIDILDNTDTLDGRHGAYTYALARDRLGDHGLRMAVESGELVGFGRGVLVDARRVFDLRTRCAAALLLTDGVLVGPTAAALHGCAAIGGFPVHVRISYDQRFRSREGLVVHQGSLAPADTMVVDHLRVLIPEAAITEVLCTALRRTALACADETLHALRPDERAEFVSALQARLAARPDRRGTQRAAALLALATGIPASPAESAFLLVLTDLNVPRPICQYEVAGHRVAFAWPQCRVALAYDGDAPPKEVKYDALTNRGWLVLSADDQDLAEPTGLHSRLREALQTRRMAA
ncbi:MAG TPA: hypothetical protein VGL06_15460 [Pseudonocardiaceae bacterium]